MLDDKTYVARYMEALAKRGVIDVKDSQALKDRAAWPHLAPADAAAQRSDIIWGGDLEEESTVEQVADIPPEPIVAVAPAENAPPVAAKPAENKSRRSALSVVPVTTYEVRGKTFTDAVEAVKYAYVTAMEEVLGVLLDIDVLAANAGRVQELTADFITRTRKD